jgi:hypothetical protein
MINPLCCGTSAYENSTQMCCKNYVRSKVDLIEPQCCDSNPYDATLAICCIGTHYAFTFPENPATTVCCGQYAMATNNTSIMCCQGTVKSTVGRVSPACCGTFVYDRSRRYCCNNLVKAAPCS